MTRSVRGSKGSGFEYWTARPFNRAVTLDPGQIRQIADSWWDDRQKIKYLESLIVRMGRPAESVVTLSCKIDCSDIEAILNTLPKNPAI